MRIKFLAKGHHCRCRDSNRGTSATPYRVSIGPDECLYSVEVVLVGNNPRDCGPGEQWLIRSLAKLSSSFFKYFLSHP